VSETPNTTTESKVEAAARALLQSVQDHPVDKCLTISRDSRDRLQAALSEEEQPALSLGRPKGETMSLRPTALAVGRTGMFVVIDDPETKGPLLIPCSWEHRQTDVSRADLESSVFEIHSARTPEAERMRKELDAVEPLAEALQKLIAVATDSVPSVAELVRPDLSKAIDYADRALVDYTQPVPSYLSEEAK
jgi:hypothetical protein